MEIPAGTPTRVKVVTAGDEYSLEEKLNEILQALQPNESLVNLQVLQAQYHSRTGGIDTALLGILIIKG